jgi:hypothetical protein
MLVKLLNDSDKNRLLAFAGLLSICDKPLLYDGQPKDEVTSRTDMSRISFKKGEAESNLLQSWTKDFDPSKADAYSPYDDIENDLLSRLKDIPLSKNSEAPAIRWPAVSAALQRIFKESGLTGNYPIRIALFELILMALADGCISSIEYRFLEEFNFQHKVDALAFNEIRERAETAYHESQKTLALILE